jgi:hypothetical protein
VLRHSTSNELASVDRRGKQAESCEWLREHGRWLAGLTLIWSCPLATVLRQWWHFVTAAANVPQPGQVKMNQGKVSLVLGTCYLLYVILLH